MRVEIFVWILSALSVVVFLALTVWVVRGILRASHRRAEPPPYNPAAWLDTQIACALEDQSLVRDARIQVRNSRYKET